MSIIVLKKGAATGPNPNDWNAVIQWFVNAFRDIGAHLLSLVTLDGELRRERSIAAERAVFFDVQAVTTTAVSRLNIATDETQVFTTALITFDATSGAVRWRMDGGTPTAALGHQIAAGGGSLTITGAQNINSFRCIGEAAATMAYTVFK